MRNGGTLTTTYIAATPALVGFWPGDIANGKMRDGSQYGHHLNYTPGTSRSLATVQANAGWATLSQGDRFSINATGRLDTGNRVVVATAEMYHTLNFIDDIDAGTSSDFPNFYSDEPYSGFMIGGAADEWYTRVSVSPGVKLQGPTINATDNGSNAVCMAFVPGVALKQCNDGGSVSSVDASAFATSLTAQNGQFAIQSNYAALRIRNYQLWVFDEAPADLETTMQWLTANPGLLPKNWYGLS